MRQLIAIPYPAPSIPAAWRLYHAGSAHHGLLATHDPESFGYLGDYVYFSTERRYASLYLAKARKRDGRSRPKRTAQVFVIDARALPEGTRIVGRRQGKCSMSVEGLFTDWIDINWDMWTLIRGGYTPEDRRSKYPFFQSRVKRLFGGNDMGAWLAANGSSSDEQVAAKLSALRQRWLQTYTRPLSWPAVSLARSRADCMRSAAASEGNHCISAIEDSIVLVPGPVPVLLRGSTGIDRSARKRLGQDAHAE